MWQYIHKNSKHLPHVAYLLNWLKPQFMGRLGSNMHTPAQEGIKYTKALSLLSKLKGSKSHLKMHHVEDNPFCSLCSSSCNAAHLSQF